MTSHQIVKFYFCFIVYFSIIEIRKSYKYFDRNIYIQYIRPPICSSMLYSRYSDPKTSVKLHI